MHTDNFITLDNLEKGYLEGDRLRTVLHGASATFSRGEFVAIVGKSGSGKSTLLNLISGIDLLDKGTISINGENLTGLDDQRRTLFRLNKIGFIFQFFNLIPSLTVMENVTFPAELKGYSVREARSRAEPLLEEVGLADRIETFPDRLSGGEQQRVAIARALINDPVLVLADEPTGNLDEGTGLHVLHLLDKISRQAGRNILLVTHNHEAAAFADRILYLREGRLHSSPVD